MRLNPVRPWHVGDIPLKATSDSYDFGPEEHFVTILLRLHVAVTTDRVRQ